MRPNLRVIEANLRIIEANLRIIEANLWVIEANLWVFGTVLTAGLCSLRDRDSAGSGQCGIGTVVTEVSEDLPGLL